MDRWPNPGPEVTCGTAYTQGHGSEHPYCLHGSSKLYRPLEDHPVHPPTSLKPLHGQETLLVTGSNQKKGLPLPP